VTVEKGRPPPPTSAHPSAQPSSDTAEKRASRYRSGSQTIDRSFLLPYILPIHHIIPQFQIKNLTFFKNLKNGAKKIFFENSNKNPFPSLYVEKGRKEENQKGGCVF
jgi:hypothetical protein